MVFQAQYNGGSNQQPFVETMNISNLLNPDGTPKFVFYYRTRPEILIEVRDGREMLFYYSVRIGSKAVPIVDCYRRVMIALMRDVYFRDDPALLKALIDTLPAFKKRYEMRTKMIEVIDMGRLPGPKFPKGSLTVHGVKITDEQQEACLAVMKGRFRAGDITAAGCAAGLDAKVAGTLTQRLLRRERDKGHVTRDENGWLGLTE